MPLPERNSTEVRSRQPRRVEGTVGSGTPTTENQPATPQERLQRALTQFRTERAMSHADVAEKLRTTPEYIVRIEEGDVDPTFSYLVKLAEAMDAHVEVSFRPREEQETPQQNTPKRRRQIQA